MFVKCAKQAGRQATVANKRSKLHCIAKQEKLESEVQRTNANFGLEIFSAAHIGDGTVMVKPAYSEFLHNRCFVYTKTLGRKSERK